MRTQSEITSCKFGAAKVPVSSFVFQTFVVIEFLLHNSFPVVCSRVLCQARSVFSLPVLLFFDTLKKKSENLFNKKESLRLSACT